MKKGKVKNWLVDKKDKVLTFCHENPEAIEAFGAIATIIGGGLTLAAALVRKSCDSHNKDEDED